MVRNFKAAAVAALCCAVAGAGLTGCEDEDGGFDPFSGGSPKATATATAESFTGIKKIAVDGRSVNVSCSGRLKEGGPVVVLLHGGGDSLGKMAALQRTLSAKDRVCSYDRLGAGASDKPDGPQSFASTGKVLTKVLERIAGDGRPVVLAGHSLGGLIAARYAPDHQERVKGLVLLDATSPTMVADISAAIPASAQGSGGDVRAQNLAIFKGQNPEQLVIGDGEVRSAGDIPVVVVKHGKPYLAAIPQYGPRLEQAWTEGQRKWLALSGGSKLRTAEKSGHYIYLEQPDVAVTAIRQVASQANGG